MRLQLYADPAGTDPLFDDPSGANPLETDAEDYEGSGSIAATASLSGTGAKADSGGAALSASATLAGAGTKAVVGGANLALTATLTGSGTPASVTSSTDVMTGPPPGAARVVGLARPKVLRLLPHVDERSGGGVLRLMYHLSGSGTAWNDDEDALELLLEAA